MSLAAAAAQGGREATAMAEAGREEKATEALGRAAAAMAEVEREGAAEAVAEAEAVGQQWGFGHGWAERAGRASSLQEPVLAGGAVYRLVAPAALASVLQPGKGLSTKQTTQLWSIRSVVCRQDAMPKMHTRW